MYRRSRTAALATVAVLSLALAACGDDGGSASEGGASADGAADTGSALDLADVCPATVVMQQDWQPEAEHGAMYHLVGEGYTVDTDKKTVTGPLVAEGVDTGVDIEVRSGGPAVNFQPVPALMYLDKDILVGAVNTDAAIAAPDQPTVALTSQLTNSPQVLMWDPESQDGAETIEEAAADGDPIVTAGELIPGLLASKGIIDPAQSDQSYEGTPQRFVSDPTILQQGFATAEPYVYEEEIPQWGKPVGFQLLSEVGYSIYPEPLAVRADDVEAEADCLEKLVPIMQQSQIDYLEDPGHANAVIVDIVEQYQTGWTYSEGVAEFAAEQMKALDIVTDDPASGVFGKLDPERMQQIVDTFVPILVEAGTLKNDDVDPESLYTNEFIDESISLGSGGTGGSGDSGE
ncbi:hypothetical protein QWY28_18735 [Nocardioides sp. SOB77]|uniref:ABC transporter substrate-binding protein n=1 Tax=Nocardioides oceani TaxID=3058369 RepID=A0ABT8FKV3_9ACTN|nr:hypothetical protein [Nocardioides oceani]MDN4175007.1 hypothetical protein [Nocardioides oceani]